MFTSTCTLYVHSPLVYVTVGWDGVGVGLECSLSLALCQVTDATLQSAKLSVPSVPTGLMLPYSWVGVWWGGMFTFTCTGTRL